jgi:hypothetical protein
MIPPYPTTPPPPRATDGIRLPENWRNLPARWVLNPDHPNHCEACRAYAREYKSMGNMSRELDGALPRYFPNCRSLHNPSVVDQANPTERLGACDNECQCWIEIQVDGVWKHVLLHT